jgi:uncharacterized protein YjbI with pentapeptide repeats
VPATIALMWARYLSAHHRVGTALQLAALGYAVLTGVLLQRLAGATLSGARREPARLRLPRRGEARAIAAVLAVVAAFALYSWSAVKGCGVRASAGRVGAEALVADAARRLCVRADLVDAEVSVKNPGWRGEERALVTGARLAGRDLQRARARGAFLAKANLARARMQEGDLRGADMRWADLADARLDGAILVGADLRGANLRGANLDGAWLHGARVRVADTAGVDLRHALGVKRLVVER